MSLAEGGQEAECEQYDSDYSGDAFRAAAKGVDSTRPVAANGAMGQIPLAQLDIWGGSHWSNKTFAKAHAQNATKPEVLSECCSCTSQRTDRSMDASCIGNQNSPGTIPTVMGSLGGKRTQFIATKRPPPRKKKMDTHIWIDQSPGMGRGQGCFFVFLVQS